MTSGVCIEAIAYPVYEHVQLPLEIMRWSLFFLFLALSVSSYTINLLVILLMVTVVYRCSNLVQGTT